MRTVGLAAAEAVVALFPIVNPIGNTPTFVALTARFPLGARLREARATAVAVAAILIVFLASGEPLLHFLGISFESLQVAGGIVIALSGLQMVIAFDPLLHVEDEGAEEQPSVAFVPMAMPTLAGPGALAVVLGLTARDPQFSAIAGFAVGILVLSVIVYVCLRLGDGVVQLFGRNGVLAMTRVFGIFVLALGVELIIHGIVEHGALVSLRGPG